MFKIAKLEKVNNEKVIINLATQEQSQYENGKKVSFEKFNTLRHLNGVEPEMDIKITRYLKNRFIIFLTFYTDYSYDENDYSGMIEFTFNLDDYLSGDKKDG